MKSFKKYVEDYTLVKYNHLRVQGTHASFWVPEGMEKEMVRFFFNSRFSAFIHLIPKTDGKSGINSAVTFSLYFQDSFNHERTEDLIVLTLKQKFTVTILYEKL